MTNIVVNTPDLALIRFQLPMILERRRGIGRENLYRLVIDPVRYGVFSHGFYDFPRWQPALRFCAVYSSMSCRKRVGPKLGK